ncbi:MAG: trypsin-like peptidase domain-containing protein [Sphaerobacter sp.]|nr:trypsin-like peptidase domain-containing protein [Sphaerobacter sp.]
MSTSNAGSTNLLTALSDSLADAVATAAPSVVRVEARRRLGATGIVWHADGLIVTADHVVERDDDITVGLPDGRDVRAHIVGRDPGTDVAVLRVDATGLMAATAAPGAARVGHLVLALGRPHGGEPMATLGLVGAVAGPWRTWRGGTVEQVIRSDVTLYPGFSGGPLIDTEGRLIGMNTSVLSRGLPVTLPHAVLARVVEALVARGKVSRGYLGIATQPVVLPAGLRAQLGLAQESGLLIVQVEPGSPAEQAGLMLGDIVIAFGGQPTPEPQALQARLEPGSVGTQQPVRVIRGGALADLTVTVGER